MSVSQLRSRVIPCILGFLAALGVAMFIELGKVLIPSRVADLTNVVLEAVGFTVGMVATARLTMALTRVSLYEPGETQVACTPSLPCESPEVHRG